MAVRLFVGNMPYGATEADLRAHFSSVGEPSQIVIPVDRETGRPRGFAFVEFLDRGMAEAAVAKFNQQAFMGRSLSVSEARPREERGPGGFRPPGAGGFTPRPPGGGFGPPRPMGAPGGFRSGPPGAAPMPGKNFGPPKKKSASSEKRWENKERGPKGPIKERYTGRLGGLYDDPDDVSKPLTDFDDPASTAPDDDEKWRTAATTHVKVLAAVFLLGGVTSLAAAASSSVVLGSIAAAIGASQEEGAPLGQTVVHLTGIALAVFFLALGIPALICGWGLLKQRRWSRTPSAVLAVVIAIVLFPAGAIFAAYALWVLLRKATDPVVG